MGGASCATDFPTVSSSSSSTNSSSESSGKSSSSVSLYVSFVPITAVFFAIAALAVFIHYRRQTNRSPTEYPVVLSERRLVNFMREQLGQQISSDADVERGARTNEEWLQQMVAEHGALDGRSAGNRTSAWQKFRTLVRTKGRNPNVFSLNKVSFEQAQFILAHLTLSSSPVNDFVERWVQDLPTDATQFWQINAGAVT